MKNIFTLLIACMLCTTSLFSQLYNTGSGTGAFNSLTTGGANTATGYQSQYYNTNSYNCSSHGFKSMYNMAYGGQNSAYGANSMGGFYSGDDNTALGYNSLYASGATCYGNTAVGSQAMQYNYSGSYNSSMGCRSLLNNSSGSYNAIVGDNAGWNNHTGSYNTFIGSSASATVANYISNSTSIGYNSLVNNTSNTVQFGPVNTSSIGGMVGWSTLSDKRVKRNVKENVPGIDFINKLTPVTYNFDVAAYDKFIDDMAAKNGLEDLPARHTEKGSFENIRFTGLLAQDVETAARSMQYSFSGLQTPQDKNGLYGLSYESMVVPLIRSTQQLNVENEKLVKEAAELSEQLKLLLKKIKTLKEDQKNPILI
jgi:hypothetical protein